MSRPSGAVGTNILEALSRRIVASGLITGRRRDSLDTDQVRKSLHAAWGTEALLQLTGRVLGEEEILRLSNNWSAIQTYYVFYHCAQALHVAGGHELPDSHPKTQNIFCDQWAGRHGDLSPWAFAYGFDGLVNVPPRVSVDMRIHSWSRCDGDNLWSIAGKALMTTRRDVVKEKRKEQRERKRLTVRRLWRAEEQRRIALGSKARRELKYALPKLTEEELVGVDRNTRPFTIMDYLYRLRIKTNYEDSNMFTDGPEDNQGSRNVRISLCQIANGTLLLYERAIQAIIGSHQLREWADAWIERNLPRDHTDCLVARRRYHDI